MIKRVFIGFGSALILWIVGCALLFAGSAISSVYGAKIIGGSIATPGYIILAPGLLGLGLIDHLPMRVVFPDGGASGLFGSVLIFALLFWSVLLGYASCRRIWPFKTSTRSTSKAATRNVA